uniref:Pre-mRNA-splicing factor 38 n=1 Tax=Rhabditophanes sp. KR3021 TaxID=114890 RepID=A0AC35TQU6_9BILA
MPKNEKQIRGTRSTFLIEKIIRTRIIESIFYKEECFGLSAETMIDKGASLKFVGGVYAGNIRPTPFLCLMLKLLELTPSEDIILEYIAQEEFKYVRALGAMYIRLTFPSVEIYKHLEPLYNDYRKLRFMNRMGRFELMHMDEFIEKLLKEEVYCDIHLPKLQGRQLLESNDQLDLYHSKMMSEIDKLSDSESEEEGKKPKKVKKYLISESKMVERERRKKEEEDAAKAAYSNRSAEEQTEIDESNALRKKLGLAPLQD